MKLAILGTDSYILHLASAARLAEHEIVWLGDVRAQDVAAIGSLAAGLVDRAAEWELLLDRGIADAVLAGTGTSTSELRAERIKRLAAEGVPLLVVQPAFDSVLPYYEVDMIRRESGAIVQHYNPLMGHPLVVDIDRWLREGHPAVGPIHQVSCERRVAGAGREEVLAHFARDAELLAAVAGDVKRITAIGPASDGTSFASLQVQMTSGASASLRWSVGFAAAGAVVLEMSLLGEKGVIKIHIADGPQNGVPIWQLETIGDNSLKQQQVAEYDPAGAAIVRLSVAVDIPRAERRPGVSTWDAATRAMEVVDAAELSLQKGRTIEVFQQQLTERLAFRGTMAAIGCGLLLVAFAAVVVATLLGGLNFFGTGAHEPGINGAEEGTRLIPFWSLALLAVLAFFLLLQVVPFLARKPDLNGAESQAGLPTKRDS
jgi:hypothetical protein